MRALVLARDLERARSAMKRAREEIAAKSLGPRAAVRADLEDARLASAQPDRRGALERYTRLAAAAAREPDLLVEAHLGHAQALLDAGSVAPVTTEMRDLLAAGDLPDPLAARATLLLADAHARLDHPRAAFLAYLRVALVHGEASPGAARAYREAAALARVHPELGGEPRARELLAELACR